MVTLFVLLIVAVVWLGLGYIGARACYFDFTDMGLGGPPTPFLFLIFLLGPVGYFSALICASREPLYKAHFLAVPETSSNFAKKFFKVN